MMATPPFDCLEELFIFFAGEEVFFFLLEFFPRGVSRADPLVFARKQELL